MNIAEGYQVCKGCKFSDLHYCKRYNKNCLSVVLNKTTYQLACDECQKEDSYEFGISPEETVTKKIAYFHLPGVTNLETYVTLLNWMKWQPKAFYSNRKVSEIYGAFPGTIWNGRTPNFKAPSPSIQEILDIKDIIEAYGISLNLTWNNHLVSGTDVYDRYCNTITKLFHNGKHSITVASKELFDYLKENYPNYTYYQSVIASSDSSEGLYIVDDRFDMYLWTRKYNKDWDKLKSLPYEKRDKIEFLCNDACPQICDRMKHYNRVNKDLLERSEDVDYNQICPIDHDFMLYNTRHWPITINPEDIDLYLDEGYCHFKLCSRGDSEPIISLKIAQYLAKPEYVDDVFVWMTNKIKYTDQTRHLVINQVVREGNALCY